MSKRIDNILYNIIIEKKLVSKDVLDEIINDTEGAGVVWFGNLCKRKLVDESTVLMLLAEKLGISFEAIGKADIDAELFKKIPVKIASHYQFVPLKLEERTLIVGTYYPLDINTQDEIRLQLGYEISILLTNKEKVLEILKRYYGLGADTLDQMFAKDKVSQDLRSAPAGEDLEIIDQIDKDATVANLVNQIIFDAYKKRATDIHIEPYRNKVRFRYRIDGILYDAHVPEDVKHFVSPILSRIKIMSSLDIVEHRLPQDGQAVVKTSDQKLDLRVSFIPTPYGESVVVRILPTKILYDVDGLGLCERDREAMLELLERPNGIVFVTGPTGSGKTTTLYTFLNHINTDDKKIITVEDPIEYEIENLTQIQVNPQIGLTFASGLRSMLRHDPDIMMVGEVRDLETAEIAIRVALTGHLVLSTLHTNSAAASIHRLLDIGIEPYLIYSSAIAFISQRLVRVLCPKCKAVDKKPDASALQLIKSELGLSSKDVKIYKKKSCDFCNQTGFYGRTAIYEILPVNELIKNLILERASANDIEKAARSSGIKTMLQNGLSRVVEGVTTLEEIMNVISTQDLKTDEQASFSEVIVEDEAPAALTDEDRRIYIRLQTKINISFRLSQFLQL